MIRPDMAGPMPLIASSSAALALLTSTAANATAAYNMTTKARIFFNMRYLLKGGMWIPVLASMDASASTITAGAGVALTGPALFTRKS